MEKLFGNSQDAIREQGELEVHLAGRLLRIQHQFLEALEASIIRRRGVLCAWLAGKPALLSPRLPGVALAHKL